MGTRRTLLAGIFPLLLAPLLAPLLGGCAVSQGTAYRIADERAASMTGEDQASLASAEQTLRGANDELAQSKFAQKDAKFFLDAAEVQNWAARSAREAAPSDPVIARRLAAAAAKRDYAAQLNSLREAQLDEKRAAVELAQADREYLKYQLLRRHQSDAGLSESTFALAHERAEGKLASRRQTVAQRQGDVAVLRVAWDDRRMAYDNLASAGAIPIDRTLTPLPSASVNEGPSSPSSVPLPTPTQLP